MPTLVKVSSPGWEKHFATEQEAYDELRKHICSGCLKGGEWSDEDGDVHCEEPPEDGNISDLLATMCGAEFWLEDDEMSENH